MNFTKSALCALVGVGLLLPAAGVAASSGKLYRWVDATGRVHISDQLPPGQAEEDREILNRQGRVVDQVNIPEPKSPEELAAEERQQAIEREQARQDEILLTNYASAAEISQARDERLDELHHLIHIAKQQVDRVNELLEKRRKQADRILGNNAPLPEYLKSELHKLSAERDAHQRYIEARQEEMAQTWVNYQQDLDRFTALGSVTPVVASDH